MGRFDIALGKDPERPSFLYQLPRTDSDRFFGAMDGIRPATLIYGGYLQERFWECVKTEVLGVRVSPLSKVPPKVGAPEHTYGDFIGDTEGPRWIESREDELLAEAMNATPEILEIAVESPELFMFDKETIEELSVSEEFDFKELLKDVFAEQEKAAIQVLGRQTPTPIIWYVSGHVIVEGLTNYVVYGTSKRSFNDLRGALNYAKDPRHTLHPRDPES